MHSHSLSAAEEAFEEARQSPNFLILSWVHIILGTQDDQILGKNDTPAAGWLQDRQIAAGPAGAKNFESLIALDTYYEQITYFFERKLHPS